MSEIKTNEEIFDEMFEEITRLENGIATKDAELARLREDKPNMCGRHKHRVALFCEECVREALKSQ